MFSKIMSAGSSPHREAQRRGNTKIHLYLSWNCLHRQWHSDCKS